MCCKASRSAGGLMGACSISNAIPSSDELANAVAVSMSTGANATKAVLPCSSALMTPLRRGISGMVHSLGNSSVQAAEDLVRVALEDLPPVLVTQGWNRIDVALRVVKVMT